LFFHEFVHVPSEQGNNLGNVLSPREEVLMGDGGEVAHGCPLHVCHFIRLQLAFVSPTSLIRLLLVTFIMQSALPLLVEQNG
jgi:hypothetical protein